MGLNAQTAVPAFEALEVLTAAEMTQVNTGIPVFATTVTRDAAFGGAGEKVLAQGQYAYIEATSTLQVYTGSAWVATALAGLVPVVPTSVSVGSGTGTANANGQVTFTTASSVSLNGVFSATYKNYLIIFNEDTASATAAIQFRMRLAGTDNSTASSYITQYIRATSTTVSAAKDTLSYGQLDVSAGTQTFASLTVFNPAIASATYFTNLANTQTNTYLEMSALTHTVATAYDGISFISASGTFTGAVSVYGYTI
jgi:hypothetical protein